MKIEQLTFTRFIAALLIIIYHFGTKSFLFLNNHQEFIFKRANISVSYFFILSGYVMILAYNEKKHIPFFEFMKNRFARIYPVYLLACLLILIYTLLTNTTDFLGFILNLFMIQAWIPKMAVAFNFPAWSISTELFFYLLFPFLFNYIYTKFNYKKLLIPIIIFWLLSQVAFHFFTHQHLFDIAPFTKKDFFYLPFMHFNEFLIGNIAALFMIHKNYKNRNLDLPIIAIVILIILSLKHTFGFNYHNGFLAILFIPLIWMLTLNNGYITKLFKMKFFVFMGEISYSMYLLQVVIWIWISDSFLENIFSTLSLDHFTSFFFIRLILLIILSSIIYQFFENPLRNKIKNWQPFQK